MYELIKNRIIRDKTVTLGELEARAEKRGVSIDELYIALEAIHKDKSIRRTTRGGDVIYTYAPKKREEPLAHTTWVRDNYPWPKEFVMPWPEWDLSYIFLTPEEMVEYKQSQGKHRYRRKYSNT